MWLQPMLGLVAGSTSGSVSNGRISCRFQRLLKVAHQTTSKRRRSTQPDVFSLDGTEYYILMAKGPALAGLCVCYQHIRCKRVEHQRIVFKHNLRLTELLSLCSYYTADLLSVDYTRN